MARVGRKPKAFELREGDRDRLRALAWAPSTENRVALRARALLFCAEGLSCTTVAQRLGMSVPFVLKWRERYEELGVDGLLDAPRSGRPRTVTDERIGEVLRAMLDDPPDGAGPWSTRDLARRVGVSPSTVARIRHAFAMQSGPVPPPPNPPPIVERTSDAGEADTEGTIRPGGRR